MVGHNIQHTIWEQEQQYTKKAPTNKGINNNLAQGRRYIEGFQQMIGPTAVNTENTIDNSAAIRQENKLSRDVSEYSLAHRMLMDKTATFIQSEGRSLSREKNVYVTQANNTQSIKPTFKGCYANSSSSGLTQQTELNIYTPITIDTCKTRASDLGYSVFGLVGGGGKSGTTCYVGNSLKNAQSAGLATKSVVSFSFPVVAGADKGGILLNGQAGSFNSSNMDTSTGFVSSPVSNCDPLSGANIIFNDNNVASWGYNCNGVANPNYVPPPPPPPPPVKQCANNYDPSTIGRGATCNSDAPYCLNYEYDVQWGTCSATPPAPVTNCANSYDPNKNPDQYTCNIAAPYCENYQPNFAWGTCSATFVPVSQCTNSYGSEGGDAAYTCDKSVPTCANYIPNQQWGTCST